MPTLRSPADRIQPDKAFNEWTVLGQPFRAGVRTQAKWYCVAQCSCGKIAVVYTGHLLTGASRNCGHSRIAKMAASTRTHGGSRSRLYRIWKAMCERCEYPKHKNYRRYGGAGIKVCAEWRTDFDAFRRWAESQGWKPGLKIDRRSNSRDYCPDNGRVVTNQENCNNKRKHAIYEAWGERKTIWHWSLDSRCMVSHGILRGRIKQGWLIERAMTTPRVLGPRLVIVAFGESKTVSEWLRDPRCVVSKRTCLAMRIKKYGYSPEQALTTPAVYGGIR